MGKVRRGMGWEVTTGKAWSCKHGRHYEGGGRLARRCITDPVPHALFPRAVCSPSTRRRMQGCGRITSPVQEA
jgi:hypothetical protein